MGKRNHSAHEDPNSKDVFAEDVDNGHVKKKEKKHKKEKKEKKDKKSKHSEIVAAEPTSATGACVIHACVAWILVELVMYKVAFSGTSWSMSICLESGKCCNG